MADQGAANATVYIVRLRVLLHLPDIESQQILVAWQGVLKLRPSRTLALELIFLLHSTRHLWRHVLPLAGVPPNFELPNNSE